MSVSIKDIGNENELDKLLNRVFTNPYRTGYVEVGEDKVCLPVYYKKFADRIKNFEVRDDDVFLFGLAKTGTTWCHEMLWMIVNDMDFEGAKQKSFIRCPMLELETLHDFALMNSGDMGKLKPLEYVENLKSPRCIKSHMHWSLLPEQIQNGSKSPNIIILFRHPKDVCVSHYHQASSTAGYKGTFEEFADLFLGGRVPYGPYWKAVLSLWQQRHRPNVLLLTYNEMKENIQEVIKRVSQFLGKAYSDEQVEKLAEHLSLSSMKNNPAVNLKEEYKVFKDDYNLSTSQNEFIRSGKVAGYGSLMSPEMSARFDEWIQKNTAGTDFKLF